MVGDSMYGIERNNALYVRIVQAAVLLFKRNVSSQIYEGKRIVKSKFLIPQQQMTNGCGWYGTFLAVTFMRQRIHQNCAAIIGDHACIATFRDSTRRLFKRLLMTTHGSSLQGEEAHLPDVDERSMDRQKAVPETKSYESRTQLTTLSSNVLSAPER